MNNRYKTAKKAIETVESLRKAVEESGGIHHAITVEYLESSSVMNFLAVVCAPNGIRFFFDKTTTLRKPLKEEYPLKEEIIINPT